MKTVLTNEIHHMEKKLIDIAKRLYDNPELGDQEFQSMKLLVDYLESHHFEVEQNIANRPTAFKAVFDSGKEGPTIGYLAEYDALPDVGHGCGHNLIAAMSTGAGIALSKVINNTGGKVIVFGTPAEETNGAKVEMAEKDVFFGVDVAMLVHAADQSYESGVMSAMEAIQFAYTGKSSHAAEEPEQGINALDGVIQLFNGVNALREHIPSDVRIHGIVKEGGEAANVVPSYAVAQFYIRAPEKHVLDRISNRVKDIAKSAATMTGASVEITNYEIGFDNLVTNKVLSDAFTKNLKQVSNHPVLPGKRSFGSSDMGDVSKKVPAIHPFIGLNKPGLVFHTKEFADQTVTKDGSEALLSGALSLALTGYDVLSDERLLEEIKQEFQKEVVNKQ